MNNIFYLRLFLSFIFMFYDAIGMKNNETRGILQTRIVPCGLLMRLQCMKNSGETCEKIDGVEMCTCADKSKKYDTFLGKCIEKTICNKGERGYEVCSRLRAECLLSNSVTNEFKCKCPAEHAANDHGTCIEINICHESHTGFIDCTNRNAVCIRNFDNKIGYQCECRPGYKKLQTGRCIAITECEEGEVGFLECNSKNATCLMDIRTYKKYICVCSDNYFKDQNGRCHEKHNDGAKMSFKNNSININDICQKGNKGYEKCVEENAICIVSLEVDWFTCHCRPNQRKLNGICTDLDVCDRKQLGYKECARLFAKCIKVTNSSKGYECNCINRKTTDPFGRCNNFQRN